MSGEGASQLAGDATGARVSVVGATWHQDIVDAMVAGACRVLAQAGAVVRVVRVPGAFELPLAAHWELEAGADAVVALGVIIRGGTPHFEYVCQAATNGLTDTALRHGKPVGFGVLTTDDRQAALDRSGLPGSQEDKGAEAAGAVVAMIGLRRSGTGDQVGNGAQS
jgi:6,7-dimethyl-8-ribityllumazine synthase